MRFAISAVAAGSGLVLLGLAFYGQPALYLHQAREEWTSLTGGLTGGSPGDQPLEPDREDPAAERIAQLQQQVTALKKELAAEPAPLAAIEPPKPAAPAEPPKVITAPVQPLREAARSEPRPAAPPAAEVVPSPIASVERAEPSATQPPMLDSGVPKMEPRISEAPKSGTAALDLAKADVPKPGPAVSEPPKAEMARVEPPNVETPRAALRGSEPPETETASLAASRTEPARAEPAKETAGRPEPSAKADTARSDVRRADPAKAEAAKSGPPKPEAPPPDVARSELAKPAPQKLAAAKPAPAPPLAQPLPPRQETEDAQSVLARLRQLGPTPPRQAGPPPPSTRPAPIASPLLPRLAAARAALADGRIEDARRLLQETQLQLVFRPIDAAGEDAPRAGRSAADVAHSLEALSANNIPLSRRFIDRAADSLSERGGDAAFQEPDLRATGYAPAYPPH